MILDWIMPDMDGLETLKLIRKTVGMDTPIIIVSAYDFLKLKISSGQREQTPLSQSLCLIKNGADLPQIPQKRPF